MDLKGMKAQELLFIVDSMVTDRQVKVHEKALPLRQSE